MSTTTTIDHQARQDRWYSADEAIAEGDRVVASYCGNAVVGTVTDRRTHITPGVIVVMIAVEDGYQGMRIGGDHSRRSSVMIHCWIDGSPVRNGEDFVAKVPDRWGKG